MLNYRLAFKLTDQILLSRTASVISTSCLRLSTNGCSSRERSVGVCEPTSLLFRRYAASSAILLNKPAPAVAVDLKPAAAVKVETPKSEIELRQLAIAKEKEDQEKAQRATIDKPKANKSEIAKRLDAYLRLMRADKPIGTLLTYWPSAWAILGVASYLHTPLPDFYMLGLFALGAFAMRSAGCIVNDIWDRRFDKHVERTKARPLTSGEVGLPAAVTLLAGNLSAALFVLMQLNLPTQVLGACALFPMAIYPASKRFSNWPQAYLGVAFNWGALMGWSTVLFSSAAAASANIFSFLPVLPLFAAGISWTLHYDTIYGFQDKEYDRKLGLKSTAIHLEKSPKKWLLGFSSLFTSNLALFGYPTSQEPIYYITLGLAAAHLVKQIAFVKLDSPESCQKQFKSNNVVGALVALGLLSSLLIK